MWYFGINGKLRRYGTKPENYRYKLVHLYRDNTNLSYIKDDKNDKFEPIEDPNGRFGSAVSRAKGRIYELAACNEWGYFITCTLDAAKYDRHNLPKFRRDFAQFLRNQRRLHGYDIKYLLIPEQHADGAWHLHGLITGVPDNELSKFVAGQHPQKLIKGGYKNWAKYAERFGFCSLGRVRNHKAVAAYITKYVAKSLADSPISCGGHLYYASQGLNGAAIVDGTEWVLTKLDKPSYEGEWCKIWWLDREPLCVNKGELTFLGLESGAGNEIRVAATEECGAYTRCTDAGKQTSLFDRYAERYEGWGCAQSADGAAAAGAIYSAGAQNGQTQSREAACVAAQCSTGTGGSDICVSPPIGWAQAPHQTGGIQGFCPCGGGVSGTSEPDPTQPPQGVCGGIAQGIGQHGESPEGAQSQRCEHHGDLCPSGSDW